MKIYKENLITAFKAFAATAILLVFVITGFFVVDAHAADIEPQEEAEIVQLTGQPEPEPEPEQAQSEQIIQIEIPDEQMQLLAEFSQELEARRSAAEDETGETETQDEPSVDGDIISSVQVCMGFIGGLLAVLVFSSALRNAT